VSSQRSLSFNAKKLFTAVSGRKADGRDGSVLAVYADKASKINNARPDADAMGCLSR
jgi:hypothetical protein